MEKNESPGQQLINMLEGIRPEKDKPASAEVLNQTVLNDPFFHNLMKASPASIAIFNHATSLYEYFSPNMEDLLGYPMSNLLDVNGQEFGFNIFHPDHMKIVMKEMETVKRYYRTYAQKKRLLDTRYTFTLQLKRGCGTYIWTLMHTAVLEVDDTGFPSRTMVAVTDMTGIKTNTKVDFVFSLKDPKLKYYEALHVAHHETFSEYKLTERELQVLNCVSKGMRNYEIAKELSISKHTVITHRRNIMQKSGKENIIQLLVE